MKKYINYIYLLALVCALGSCKKTEDFLLLRDRDGLDSRIWEEEGAVQYFLNETYNVIMPDFCYQYNANNYTIHLASDENYFSANDAAAKKLFNFNGSLLANDVKYLGIKYQGDNIGDNRYFDVAKCNLAIANLPGSKGIVGDSKRKLLGQFYVLRGMLYLGMTKIYGGMPLVLDPQDPDELKLSGRVKAKVMIAQVISDLNQGMELLNGVVWNDATERGKLTRAAAACLKARALLLWASPQFNPINDPQHPYSPERWQDAHQACKEAYDICTTAGYALMPDYGKLFQVEGTANTEAIIVKSYSDKIPKRNNNIEAWSRPNSENGQPADYYYASTFMIDAYNMKDGTPINQSTQYDPVLFWLNRDPRFEASIAYNGCKWKLSGNNNRRQWTYVNAINETGNRGFYCKRFASPDLPFSNVRVANDLGGSGMDWIELRFAEVLLNYAETANETGDLTLAKQLIRRIRKRANIEEGAYDYGLALATNKDQLRDLIMNERMVEFAFEGKRGDDLRRTRRMHLLQGQLTCMQFETVSTQKKDELEAINPQTGLRNRDTLDMTNKSSVLAYFKYPYRLVYPAGNVGFGMPAYYYFFGLSSQFMNSTPLLEQTIGWEGGTFDPL